MWTEKLTSSPESVDQKALGESGKVKGVVMGSFWAGPLGEGEGALSSAIWGGDLTGDINEQGVRRQKNGAMLVFEIV